MCLFNKNKENVDRISILYSAIHLKHFLIKLNCTIVYSIQFNFNLFSNTNEQLNQELEKSNYSSSSSTCSSVDLYR